MGREAATPTTTAAVCPARKRTGSTSANTGADTTRRRRKPKRAKQLGVSDSEYARLLEEQGGHCALCPAVPKTRRLNVDHDHESGRVRGLLCHRCNRALPAWMREEWLTRAASYLSASKGPGA